MQQEPSRTATPSEETSADAGVNSNTKVHFSKTPLYKYVSGEREPISIRIDTGLYSVFKPLSKRIYGSVCKAIETYIITLIEATENGVHFCNTEGTRIVIEKLVIERNLAKERRNLRPVRFETTPTPTEPECDICGKTPVTASFRHKSGITKQVCSKHEADLRDHPKWSEYREPERREE